MPKFKHKETGRVIEVAEEHARQVLRRQKAYAELTEEEPEKCPVENAPTESTNSEVQNASTPQKKPVGRPKKHTTQARNASRAH